jgi:polar amino acid transport system permease protein
MGYTFDFSVIFDSLPELLYGCLLTMELSIAGMAIALIIAVLAVLALRSRPRLFGFPIQVFVEVVRNTPFLIQIFFIYFGLPAAGIRFDPNVAAVIALAINGAAYAIEIIRSGVDAVAKGQIEAGYALGLRPVQIFRYVILRPALRSIYPALASQFIFLMLTSSIVSSISARELTHVAAVLEGITFRSFEVYLAVTVLYGLMAILLSLAFNALYRFRIAYPTR